MNQPSFLAVLSAFLLIAHLPGAEPKPQIADLKPCFRPVYAPTVKSNFLRRVNP